MCTNDNKQLYKYFTGINCNLEAAHCSHCNLLPINAHFSMSKRGNNVHFYQWEWQKKYVFQLQFISNSYLKTCSKEQLVLAQDLYGDVLLLFFQSKTVYFHSKGSLVSNMFSSNTILISMSINRGQNVKCILHQNIYK